MGYYRVLVCIAILGAAVAASVGEGIAGTGLALGINQVAVVAGDQIVVNAHANAVAQGFTAWALIVGPSGQTYSMSLSGKLRGGMVPLGSSPSGLTAPRDVTLLDMAVPGGIQTGKYAIAAWFLPPGVTADGIADAAGKAIEGYFDQTAVYVISGKITVDITGTWDTTIEGVGKGTMTLTQTGLIVEGSYSGSDGKASVLGFIDMNAVVLFLTYESNPGAPSMELEGTAVDTTMSGTYISTLPGPSSGIWSAELR
jgi:hypothetical protein